MSNRPYSSYCTDTCSLALHETLVSKKASSECGAVTDDALGHSTLGLQTKGRRSPARKCGCPCEPVSGDFV